MLTGAPIGIFCRLTRLRRNGRASVVCAASAACQWRGFCDEGTATGIAREDHHLGRRCEWLRSAVDRINSSRARRAVRPDRRTAGVQSDVRGPVQMSRAIHLTTGMAAAIVDDADFDRLNAHRWSLSNGYAIRSKYDPATRRC